jgi:hypothetical protein
VSDEVVDGDADEGVLSYSLADASPPAPVQDAAQDRELVQLARP